MAGTFKENRGAVCTVLWDGRCFTHDYVSNGDL
jgi:hypothetical protein